MSENYEIVRYPKIKHIRIFVDEIRYRTQHLHGDYELCFGLKGEGKFFSLNQEITLKKGQILFIDSHEAHSIVSVEDPFIGLFIQVSDRFLSDYLPEMSSHRYKNLNLEGCLAPSELEHLFNQGIITALDYLKESQNYRMGALSYVSEILNAIFSNVPQTSLSGKEIDNRKKNAERLQRIIEYIDGHIQEKVSQKEIAEQEGITTTHLSHIFASGLGISFQDYINERRLELAIRMMRNSTKTIIEISYEAGFSDPKYMSKLFRKRFGCTPKQFKKQNILYPVSAKKENKAILERIYKEKEAIAFLESL